MTTDTFERSCEHWSETRRGEMEDFYALATVDYRHLAESRDWRTWFEERQTAASDRALRLLDVACGSGKFPAALLTHADLVQAAVEPVRYDLLDPSGFSIREARAALAPPFVPGAEFETTLQAFTGTGYDVVWATHALYAVPEAELAAALERFLAALAPDGRGFIAHSADAGHYIEFYRRFLADFREGRGTPYTGAERIAETLTSLGAEVATTTLRYDNGVPESERDRVTGFLQRCAFDDSVSLQAMLAAPELGAYLRGCLTDGYWRFRQQVVLMEISR